MKWANFSGRHNNIFLQILMVVISNTKSNPFPHKYLSSVFVCCLFIWDNDMNQQLFFWMRLKYAPNINSIFFLLNIFSRIFHTFDSFRNLISAFLKGPNSSRFLCSAKQTTVSVWQNLWPFCCWLRFTLSPD